jgi:hypothetical protein
MTGEVRRNKSCFYRLFRDTAIQSFSSSRIFESKSTRTFEIAEITKTCESIYQLNMIEVNRQNKTTEGKCKQLLKKTSTKNGKKLLK